MELEDRDLRILQQIEDKGLRNSGLSSDDYERFVERAFLAVHRLYDIAQVLESDLNLAYEDKTAVIDVIRNLASMPKWDMFPGCKGSFDEPMNDYQKYNWATPKCYIGSLRYNVDDLTYDDLEKVLRQRPDLEDVIVPLLRRKGSAL